jgi:hypothetical protein
VLRLLAADDSDAYAAHFAADLACVNSPSAAREERARAMRRLGLAGPAGTVDAALRVLADPGASRAECADAVSAVANFGPSRFPPLLDAACPRGALASAVAVAGTRRDRRDVEPLLRLLEHEDREIRELAQRSLFARLSAQAPHLARLDVAAFPSAAYRGAVADLRAWWAREQDSADSQR